MPKLHKFLRRCFGYAAVASSGMAITLVPVFLRAPFPHTTSQFHTDPFQLLLIAMREIILLMPAVVAVVTAMAWWTLRKGSPLARRWAIAASISSLVLSAPFLDASIAIVQYSLAGPLQFAGVLVLFVFLLSLGVAGLVAFRKRKAPFVADLSRPNAMSDTKNLDTLASAV
jgi:hypothetical protein